MWKKISLQIVLLLLAIFSIFFTYKVYLNPEKNLDEKKLDLVETKGMDPENKKNKETKEAKVIDKFLEEKNNLIKNLKYISKDSLGNEYIIESKYSELNQNNDDIINMKEVTAKIIMINSKPIFIYSDFAKYNNKKYETIFTGNVLVTYLDNKITCENFAISIENNLASVSEDVIFENSKGKLLADTIEIDLITKNSKIFMNNKNKKVIVLNK